MLEYERLRTVALKSAFHLLGVCGWDEVSCCFICTLRMVNGRIKISEVFGISCHGGVDGIVRLKTYSTWGKI